MGDIGPPPTPNIGSGRRRDAYLKIGQLRQVGRRRPIALADGGREIAESRRISLASEQSSIQIGYIGSIVQDAA